MGTGCLGTAAGERPARPAQRPDATGSRQRGSAPTLVRRGTVAWTPPTVRRPRARRAHKNEHRSTRAANKHQSPPTIGPTRPNRAAAAHTPRMSTSQDQRAARPSTLARPASPRSAPITKGAKRGCAKVAPLALLPPGMCRSARTASLTAQREARVSQGGGARVTPLTPLPPLAPTVARDRRNRSSAQRLGKWRWLLDNDDHERY